MTQPFRRRLEQRSAGVLSRMSRLPAWLPLVTVVVLTVAGLRIRGPVGALLLLVLAALAGWLCYVSWPTLAGNARADRLFVLAVLVVLAVRQYTLT